MSKDDRIWARVSIRDKESLIETYGSIKDAIKHLIEDCKSEGTYECKACNKIVIMDSDSCIGKTTEKIYYNCPNCKTSFPMDYKTLNPENRDEKTCIRYREIHGQHTIK